MEVTNFETMNDKIAKLEKRIEDLKFHFETLENEKNELDLRYKKLEQQVMNKLKLVDKQHLI